MARSSVDNCRRRLRKRAHFRSLCCLCWVILGIGFLIYTYTSSPSSSSAEEKEYNLLLDKLKVKGRGKTSLLYVDKSEYIFADEQPDTSDIRNILAKQPFFMTPNMTLSDEENKTKVGQDKYYDVNHDASIEENAVPESYKWHINLPRTTTCTQANPAKHVVVLRSHRTGSHTIGNIFYRYGDFNNLFFALPKAGDFQQYWPLRFHHTRVDKSLLGKDPPNFLINTARNSRINIKSFLSRETYKIAVMRDPVSHFQSVYESIDMPFLMAQLTNSSEHFKEFVGDPKMTLEKITNVTNLFDPVFYLLHNGQLFDFGYNVDDYTNTIDLQFVLHELDEYLDLVLINEYMDESLVLLQRMLCWQLSDVAYIKKRVRRTHLDISEQEKKNIRKWNRHDTLLYNHFNDSLWEKISKQDESFWRDVKQLKTMNLRLHAECVNETNVNTDEEKDSPSSSENSPLRITYTKLNTTRNHNKSIGKHLLEVRNVIKDIMNPNIKHVCERLMLTEKEYIQFLKLKQKGILQKKDDEKTKSMFFRNSTEGQFYYELMRSLAKNKTNIVSATEPPDVKPVEEEVAETTLLGLSHTD